MDSSVKKYTVGGREVEVCFAQVIIATIAIIIVKNELKGAY